VDLSYKQKRTIFFFSLSVFIFLSFLLSFLPSFFLSYLSLSLTLSIPFTLLSFFYANHTTRIFQMRVSRWYFRLLFFSFLFFSFLLSNNFLQTLSLPNPNGSVRGGGVENWLIAWINRESIDSLFMGFDFKNSFRWVFSPALHRPVLWARKQYTPSWDHRKDSILVGGTPGA